MPRQAPAQTNETATRQAQPAQSAKQYTPSTWVKSRIDSIPAAIKQELKKIYNLDVDEVAKSEKRYGVLEGFAGNNFTLHPVLLEIDQREEIGKTIRDAAAHSPNRVSAAEIDGLMSQLPALKKEKGWFTVRFWMSPDGKTWGLERHEARIGFSRGEDGEFVKKDDGTDKMTWDRQPLAEGEAIRRDGHYFTKDQMDHFRLTNTLGDAVEERKGYKKELYADPAAIENEMKRRLDNAQCVKIIGNLYKVPLDDRATLSRALKGESFWVSNPSDPKDTVCIWYDASSHDFRPANVSYYLDDYNNHETCRYYTKFVELQLKSKLGEKDTFYMDGTQYRLDANAIRTAAMGGYVWASNVATPSDKVNVWFDPRTRNFRPTIAADPRMSYDVARRNEIAEAQKAARAAKESQSQARTQSQSQGR